MNVTLPLDQMTLAEKLRTIEILWEDISRHEADLQSPAWHGSALKETERRVAEGLEHPLDWETAKKELRRRFE